MDKLKIIELEELVHENISKHTASIRQTKDGKLVHFELTIKFRTDAEIDAAIAQISK